MTTVGIVASVVLGAILALAGGSKLRLGRVWNAQAADLGAPAWIAPFVPWVELVVGALLIAQVGRVVVALVAIVILVSFTVLIVANLRRGRRPVCACFGALSSAPLGWSHVARNLVFVVIGVLATFD